MFIHQPSEESLTWQESWKFDKDLNTSLFPLHTGLRKGQLVRIKKELTWTQNKGNFEIVPVQFGVGNWNTSLKLVSPIQQRGGKMEEEENVLGFGKFHSLKEYEWQ